MTEPRSFNPGRWSVRGLVFWITGTATGMVGFALGWGDPENAIHLQAIPSAEWLYAASLATFAGGALSESGIGGAVRMLIAWWEGRK